MKKIIISIFTIIALLLLIYFTFMQRTQKSPLAIAGNTISQLRVLQNLLERFETNNKRLPNDLNELSLLAAELKVREALQFINPDSGLKVEWFYFNRPLETSEGLVLVASPAIFTSENHEVNEFSKTGSRVALLKGGEIKFISIVEFTDAVPRK